MVGVRLVSLLQFSADIKMLILIFESQKWVILGPASAKRDASPPFVVRDGAWVGWASEERMEE